jgi:ribonuclease P protein component
MSSNSFLKNEKLCQKDSIDLIFAQGEKISDRPIKLLWTEVTNQQLPLQTLISVPKRRIPKACDRNRIKRLIRESFRLHKQPLIDQLIQKKVSINLAILYSENKVLDYKEIHDKICLTLQRLSQKYD